VYEDDELVHIVDTKPMLQTSVTFKAYFNKIQEHLDDHIPPREHKELAQG
jgi:hypothetical protein